MVLQENRQERRRRIPARLLGRRHLASKGPAPSVGALRIDRTNTSASAGAAPGRDVLPLLVRCARIATGRYGASLREQALQALCAATARGRADHETLAFIAEAFCVPLEGDSMA